MESMEEPPKFPETDKPPVFDLDADGALPESSYASSNTLWAAAQCIGHTCAAQNLAYLRCKKDEKKPLECLSKGVEVTKCVAGVLQKAKSQCSESFLKFEACLDKEYGRYENCRATQAAFLECFNGDP